MSINILVENIQSIVKGNISIKENAINIKYGYNGLGKSSIAKAIDYYINGLSEQFDSLKPFNGSNSKISISTSFSSCMSFNKEYINKWLFQSDNNLINESYSIFFNDDSLLKKEDEINASLLAVSKNAELEPIKLFVGKVDKIKSQLKFNKDRKTINGNSTVGKGFKNGPAFAQKISKSDLKQYNKLINNTKSPEWFSWFNNGSNFIVDNQCPYCLQTLPEDFLAIKDRIAAIVKENDFKKNNTAKQIVIDLSSVTDFRLRSNIETINTIEEPLTSEQQEELAKSFWVANAEKEKIERLINQSRFSIRSRKNKEEVKEFYLNNKLDLSYFANLDDEISECANNINNSIDKLLDDFDDFYKMMEEFNDLIKCSITSTEEEINTFLTYAGIPYTFNINVDENGLSETTLRPNMNDSIVLEDAVSHLSYGEINVLSLALFGAIAKRTETDLIILDDPISSFDENKKFAVMHYLFNNENGVLKNKTVIIFTHDMEPLLDLIKNDFIGSNKEGYLLINSKGIVSEKEIKKEDIQSIISSELNQAKTNPIDYLKIIHLRRYCELIGISHKDSIYEVLSNAEHLRAKPIDRKRKELDPVFLQNGVNKINSIIPGFDYYKFINAHSIKDLIDLYKQSNDNYEKIRLIRPILDSEKSKADKVDSKLRNFITENYHIENLYLYTIFGVKQIPDYVIDLCDLLVDKIEKKQSVN